MNGLGLSMDKQMIIEGRRDEGARGDIYVDTSNEGNDRIDDISDRSWSFFSSVVMTTLGVGVRALLYFFTGFGGDHYCLTKLYFF
jgi:hypothetical protein